MTTNFKYNGPSKYGRFDLSYPNSYFFQCKTLDSLNQDLTQVFSELNYDYSILEQSQINSFYMSTASKILFEFKFPDDNEIISPAKRFRIEAYKTWIYTNTTTFVITQFNSLGQINFQHSFSNSLFHDSLNNGWTQPNFAITATEDSLAIFCISTNKNTNTSKSFFIGFSKLQNVNSNYNYYNLNYTNSLCYFFSNNLSPIEIRYKLLDITKLAHVEEKTNFPIVCSDGRKPFRNWATNCLVFDNYPELQNPLIGTTSNIFALGWGDFNLAQITKITSGIEDNNSQFYLPIANYGSGNKTFMMRILS